MSKTCRNFCQEWQLWWEHGANRPDFIFWRPIKMYLCILRLPLLAGTGRTFGWLSYFRVQCVCDRKACGFLALLPLQGIKEQLPLEGFLEALRWFRSHPEPPPGYMHLDSRSLVRALKLLKEVIKGAVSIWEWERLDVWMTSICKCVKAV